MEYFLMEYQRRWKRKLKKKKMEKKMEYYYVCYLKKSKEKKIRK